MKGHPFNWPLSCVVVLLACLGGLRSGRADSMASGIGGFTPLGIGGSPNAVSADGTVVVGQYVVGNRFLVHAFRWMETTGLLDLGMLPGAIESGATAASADGTVIVGWGSSGSFGVALPPWRWTAETGMVPLDTLPPGFTRFGQANDVSDEGTVVVGAVFGTAQNGVDVFQPFRWTANTGIVPLGTLGGPQAGALGVSAADGTVVVGSSSVTNERQEAFRWTAETSMIGLGGLVDDPVFSVALDTSADGRVVVGTSNVVGGNSAFRWTVGEGMVSLGDLPGGVFSSAALAVSADGSVIVGVSEDGAFFPEFADQSAFIWDAVNGMRALRDVLLAQGADVSRWRLASARGISADGRVIVGTGLNPDGRPEAWLARLAPAPYLGTPVDLPGTIEAENFDNGGEGVAYHDESAGNSGGGYRATDVDVQPTIDAGGGYNVGWVGAGEWLNYTVTVATAGLYALEVRVASLGAGGTFHLEVNGIDTTGAIVVPDTGSWQSWTSVGDLSVPLASGTQVLRLVMDTAGNSGAVGNFNWMRLALESSGSTPYTGTPIELPGTVEAEHFDNGGEAVAYHDDSVGNSGGAYRVTDVDVQPTTDTGGGYNVGWVSAGEWLNYTVQVATQNVYTVQVRVASLGVGGTFHLEVNGIDMTGAIAVPDTGSWQRWTSVGDLSVPLASGTQVLRLVMDTAGSSGAVGNFNWIRLSPEPRYPVRMTFPAPGTTLLTTAVTFQWNGVGDDFVLNIGSAPGFADVYASAPLGPATEHTVSGLPLNGRPLYVELRRRLGDRVESLHTHYIAPFRKGLAIITDFADRRLEDWTGPGMKSVDDLSAQLRSMEQHWAWLSRGRERMQWDIIRVQLPQPAVEDAYSWWGAFRDAVITQAHQEIQTADYDVNSDGVIDAAWLIVSSGYQPVPFAIGGTSRNAGANVFVDGQASGSIQAGATGNFTHEFGHCLGLPDMYGTFGTMSALTVMSFSWPVPPPDFSAYERLKLGWLVPQVIGQTTYGVWLPSANEQIAAVMIPTGRPVEYFLIEYRRRPASGYGSVDIDFNGLAIYHVLEGSSMGQDPPIMKLEPADGRIMPSEPTDPYDFVSPDNPAAAYPSILRSYFGGGQEVFRIDNVAWRDGGLAFDITIAGPQPASNLLANGSFEVGQAGLPDRWIPDAYVAMPDAFDWPNSVALTGATSAHLNVPTDNDVRWTQAVTTLVSQQAYLLCGWLKGEQIGGSHGDVGANVSLLGGFMRSEGLLGTFDWTQRCVSFTAETPRVEVSCRLGFYGSTISGKVWCDDFTLEHVRKVF